MTQNSSFSQRITFGTIVTLVMLTLISFSHQPGVFLALGTVIGATICMSLYEYYEIAKKRGYLPDSTLGISLSALYITAVVLFYKTELAALAIPLCLFLMLFVPFFRYLKEGVEPIASIAITLFGLVYLAIPLTMLYQINYYFPVGNIQYGSLWLLYLLLVTKMSDTVAYFVGSKFGKNKLAPRVSPKKSIEGAVGGLIGSLLTSLAFYFFTPIQLSFFEASLLGLVIGFLAEFGDLAESLLKRDAGVKDSNNLPGLGGVLDIVDSLTFTAPFVFLYINYRWPL